MAVDVGIGVASSDDRPGPRWNSATIRYVGCCAAKPGSAADPAACGGAPAACGSTSAACGSTNERTRSTGSTISCENPLRLTACTRIAETPSIDRVASLDSEKPDVRAFG